MSQYTKKDAAEETESSSKDVTEAWHQARDDSGVREGRDKEELQPPPDSAEKTTESGIPLFPDRNK